MEYSPVLDKYTQGTGFNTQEDRDTQKNKAVPTKRCSEFKNEKMHVKYLVQHHIVKS